VILSYLLSVFGWLAAALAAGVTIWNLAKRDARKQAESNEIRNNLRISVKSRDIENEVESLSADDLQRRASVWLRNSGK
jgi:hypothetical protein